MKKYFKVFIVFTILSIQVFSQCDSVRVKMSTYSGDTDKNLSKTVSKYDNFGNLISYEYYDNSYPDYQWTRFSRRLYSYDVNDKIISELYQSGNDTGWINNQRNLYTYNSFGTNISKTQQNWINNAWVTNYADSSQYDSQNKILSFASYRQLPSSRKLFSYNGLNLVSSIIFQSGDTITTWRNNQRQDNYYNLNHDTILEIELGWNGIAWDSVSRTTFSSINNLHDSILTQHFVFNNWENKKLIIRDYDSLNRISRVYFQMWIDTLWTNTSSVIYDYGFLNNIIHQQYLEWQDSTWVNNIQIINEVDSNGYPSYTNNCEIELDDLGSITYGYCYGHESTVYSPTGELLSYSGHNSPGGPYYGNYVYTGRALRESHTHYETMGGIETESDNYYFYEELQGDSVICAGQSTKLYVDSCAGDTYHWSNGATTPSINTSSPGNYFVDVTNQYGVTERSQSIKVSIVGGLPYVPSGQDSLITVCGNSNTGLFAPQQNNVSYQWFRNDSIIINSTNSSLSLYSSRYINGTYYLVATNICGSDTSSKTTINILPFPARPTITPNGLVNLCEGDSIILTSSPALRYKWSSNAKDFIDSTQSIKIGWPGDYYVAAYDSAGCSSYYSSSVHVNQQWKISSISLYFQNGELYCNSGSIFQWFLNGDTIMGATSRSYKPLLSGYYKIASAVYDASCATFSDSFYVNPAVPNIHIHSTAYGCENGQVYIGNDNPVIGGTPPYQFYWQPDVNLIGWGPGHAKVLNLTHDIVYYLTVVDSNGITAKDSVQVFVDHPSPPQLIVHGSLCYNEYHSIYVDNSENYDVLKWIVNGDTVNSTNPFFSSPPTGIYQVITNDQYGCPVSSLPDTFYFLPPLSIPIIHAELDSNACINGKGTLWINSRPGENYAWYKSPPYKTLISEDTVAYANIPTDYYLYITDSNNCQSESYITFDLLNESISFEIYSKGNLCDDDSVTLCTADFIGWTYKWYLNDTLQNETSNTFLAFQPGNYKYVATSPSGCSATDETNLYHAPDSVVTIYSINGVLNTNSELPFASFQWYLNGVEIPGALSNNYTPVVSGDYSVKVWDFYRFTYACYNFSNTVRFEMCHVDILPIDSVVCNGQCTGQLKAIGHGNGSLAYAWSDGKINDINNNLCAGQYTVTITDSLGCVASVNSQILNDSLSFAVNKKNTSCIGCANGKIEIISLNAIPPYTISWQPMSGVLYGTTIDSLPAGNYQICITDHMNCTECILDTILNDPLTVNNMIANSIYLFPNPVLNELTIIGLSKVENYDAKIYNTLGEVIKNFRVSDPYFNVAELAPGLYTLILYNVKRFYLLTFMKE